MWLKCCSIDITRFKITNARVRDSVPEVGFNILIEADLEDGGRLEVGTATCEGPNEPASLALVHMQRWAESADVSVLRIKVNVVAADARCSACRQRLCGFSVNSHARKGEL